MRRIMSFLMAAVMLVSTLSVSVSAYSADKITAQQKLEEIQTKKGYINGETAIVTGNCYGFISKVCEELYGVGYNGEGLYNNYQCSHTTGNYYTVSTFTTTNTYPSSDDVENIISFFTTYASPGDIVHYGGLNSSGTHTFMVQSVDSEKMQIFHANYETTTYSRNSCHIDTIFWDSFRGNPTKNLNTTKGYSLNALFYNKMKTSGLGITINRFSNYDSMYEVVTGAVPIVSATRSSPTAIKLSWNAVSGAEKYNVEYKKSSDSEYSTATENCTNTQYTVKKLTLNESYDFKVRAYAGGSWNEYSMAKTITVLPPTISSVTFTNEVNGIKMSWAKRTDISGVRIYRSTSKNGTYTLIADLTENGVSSYLDTNVEGKKTYYYKFSRYLVENGVEYSTTSSAKSITCTMIVLTPPSNLSAKNSSLTAITLSWGAVSDATYYIVEYKDGSKWKVYATTSSTSKKISSLGAGKKYSFRVKASNGIVEGPYSSTLSKKTAVPTPSKPKASNVSKGIKLSWSKVSGVSGYKIYRATSKNGSYKLVKTIKKGSTKTWTDKSVKNKKGYYYKISAYQKKGGKTYSSAKSSAKYKKFSK